jgi:hypothetical protein
MTSQRLRQPLRETGEPTMVFAQGLWTLHGLVIHGADEKAAPGVQ